MDCKYGTFTDDQVAEFKKRLHSKIHWLLIYKENDNRYLDDYFQKVMKFLIGLNNVLNSNPIIIELMTVLQVAHDESKDPDCDFKTYRSSIFEAHNIIDRL